MNKRSRLEIYFDTLQVIEGGENKPTRIMYQTNLSWMTLHDVLETLHKRGFIEVRKKGRSNRYYIKDKGKRALSDFMRSVKGLPVIPMA